MKTKGGRWRLAVLLALLAGTGGPAWADELADAMKAVQQHDFARARALFTPLAQAGNAQAQQQLGELYGYGDGVPEDRSVAEQWLRKSLAAGNQAAADSLARLDARARRKDEIAYYTTRYDGADVSLAHFHCTQPEVPARSETRDSVRKVDRSINAWMACYRGFTAHLGDQLPVGMAIPLDLADLMSVAEFGQARARMSDAYRQASLNGKAEADKVLGARRTWLANTEQYVKEGKLLTDNMFRLPGQELNPHGMGADRPLQPAPR
jgi:TPR repeat protein